MRRIACAVTVALLLGSTLPVVAAGGPGTRIQDSHVGHQAGVVYSLSTSGSVTFSSNSEVCVNLDYHEPWHEASWSLVIISDRLLVSATVIIVDTAGGFETRVIADARGVGGPREDVAVFDPGKIRGGTGLFCLGFDRLPARGAFGPDEIKVVVGAPDAAWTRVDVDLRTDRQVTWDQATIPQFAGEFELDRDMEHRGTAGVDVRAAAAQASALWGTDHVVPDGNRSFVLAGPMPFGAAEGRWRIDGPGNWDASWFGVPGAPLVSGLGLIGFFDAPPGTYAFRYDGASVGFHPGFFAHTLPYDAPPFPSPP